jgi:predicted phage terminase large subunit-like protein
VKLRENAPKRDATINREAATASKFVTMAVESSLDAKDAYHYLKKATPDITWREIKIQGDKATRAAPLEPIFEAPGHVHIVKNGYDDDWIDEWIDEIMKFTGSGKEHDDGVDNLSAGYILLVGKGSIKMDDETREQMAQRRRR